MLRDVVRTAESNANCLHTLRALHALGNDTEVVPFLERRAKRPDGLGFELEWWNDVLREIYGGGPDAESHWGTKPAAFIEPWLV